MGEALPTKTWSSGRIVDLGSGGGVPSLVLALRYPGSRWLLVESQRRRAAFLVEAVEQLGLADRVDVREARAEEVARSERGEATVVTARSFGPPPVTAECAAPLLRVGGWLVVSEPPASGDEHRSSMRWPSDGLALLGLEVVARPPGDFRFVVLRSATPCPPAYPRRVGVPAKRPLW
jgi:16S rRNA (guanine527-N7)-methyltransferase